MSWAACLLRPGSSLSQIIRDLCGPARLSSAVAAPAVEGVAPGPAAFAPGFGVPPRCLFPLRLAGQLRAHPVSVGQGIMPGHPNHRMALAPVAGVVSPSCHALCSPWFGRMRVFGVGNRIPADVEGIDVQLDAWAFRRCQQPDHFRRNPSRTRQPAPEPCRISLPVPVPAGSRTRPAAILCLHHDVPAPEQWMVV